MSAVGRRYAQVLMAGLGGSDPEKVLGGYRDSGRLVDAGPGFAGGFGKPWHPGVGQEQAPGRPRGQSGLRTHSLPVRAGGHRESPGRQWAELVDAFAGCAMRSAAWSGRRSARRGPWTWRRRGTWRRAWVASWGVALRSKRACLRRFWEALSCAWAPPSTTVQWPGR